MSSERIEFAGSEGAMLAGRLDTPDTGARAWAVFAHCFTCSKDTKAAAYIAAALTKSGFGVMRFDFTGLGNSDGDFSNTNFSSNVDDLVAAAEWLEIHRGAPAILIGHSLGGAAVLAAAHRIANCVAIATLCAPFEPAHVAHQFASSLHLIETDGQATVQLAGREFTIKREFIADLAGQAQVERIHNLNRPLLVLHPPMDKTVNISNAKRIFETAQHPKSFVALDGADHMLNRAGDAQFAAAMIATWATRYLVDAQATAV